MSIHGVGSPIPVSLPVGPDRQTSSELTAAPETGCFTRLVDGLLGGAHAEQAQADEAVRQLATGQSDNLHDVMLQVAQADLSFRTILEVRNRLTEAYQEIMRMQV